MLYFGFLNLCGRKMPYMHTDLSLGNRAEFLLLFLCPSEDMYLPAREVYLTYVYIRYKQ